MHNQTAGMVTHPQVARRKQKRWYRLCLVIDQVDNLNDAESNGYDVDNSKPWPLGHYSTERQAIAQRNFMVMIDPQATGDPRRDKLLLDAASLTTVIPTDQATLAAKIRRRRKRKKR